MATKLSPNFNLEDFTKSEAAKKYGLSNKPNAQQIANLKRLCNEVLEPIRARYGKPIKITSGFRSTEVNKKVGGAENSQHLTGGAADIQDQDKTKNGELFNVIKNMITSCELRVGQLIWEYGNDKYPSWVHVSIPYAKVNDIFRIR